MNLINFRKLFMVKVLALLIASIFILEQVTFAQGEAMLLGGVKTETVQDTRFSKIVEKIPYALAQKTEVFTSGSDECIVHIQDAHASLSAQHSISKLLGDLYTNYDINLIAIEGAKGYVDTSVLKTFPVKDIRDNIAGELLEEGLLSAGSFFSITSDAENVMLYGIEDEELYNKNLESFRAVADERAVLVENTQKLTDQLDSIGQAIFKSDLIKLEKTIDAHRNKNLSFVEYWEKINKLLGKYPVDHERYGEIKKLLTTIECEEKIDFKKANIERKQLIDELSTDMKKKELEGFLVKTVAFKKNQVSPADFHKYLVEISEKKEIDLRQYADLVKYTIYVSRYEEIDLPILYFEIEEIEDALRDRLLHSRESRELSDMIKMSRLLNGLYSMELKKRDFGVILENKEKFIPETIAGFIKNKCLKYTVEIEGGYDLSLITANIDKAISFYRDAENRDNALLTNTLRRMRSKGKKAAVLIAGGYHTDGLTSLMKEKGLSYLVVTPKFEGDEERAYFVVLTKKKSEYKEMLRNSSYKIAAPDIFDGFSSISDIEELEEKIFSALAELEFEDTTIVTIKKVWIQQYEAWIEEHKDEISKEVGFRKEGVSEFWEGLEVEKPSKGTVTIRRNGEILRIFDKNNGVITPVKLTKENVAVVSGKTEEVKKDQSPQELAEEIAGQISGKVTEERIESKLKAKGISVSSIPDMDAFVDMVNKEREAAKAAFKKDEEIVEEPERAKTEVKVVDEDVDSEVSVLEVAEDAEKEVQVADEGETKETSVKKKIPGTGKVGMNFDLVPMSMSLLAISTIAAIFLQAVPVVIIGGIVLLTTSTIVLKQRNALSLAKIKNLGSMAFIALLLTAIIGCSGGSSSDKLEVPDETPISEREEVKIGERGKAYYNIVVNGEYPLLRNISSKGDISEYFHDIYSPRTDPNKEDLHGRVSLLYDKSDEVYRTYDWDDAQGLVTVTEYYGEYILKSNTSLDREYIEEGDKKRVIVYQTDKENWDLGPLTNGWILEEQKDYDENGDMKFRIYYDDSGSIESIYYPSFSDETSDLNGDEVEFFYKIEDRTPEIYLGLEETGIRSHFGEYYGRFLAGENSILTEKTQKAFRTYLKRSRKVKNVSLFFFGDYKNGLEIDETDLVVSVEPEAVDKVLEIIEEENKILHTLVMFDYMIADGVFEKNGEILGEFQTIFTDAALTEKFWDEHRSLLERIKGNPNVKYVESVNEPDLIKIDGKTDRESRSLAIGFMEQGIPVIREATGKPISVSVRTESQESFDIVKTLNNDGYIEDGDIVNVHWYDGELPSADDLRANLGLSDGVKIIIGEMPVDEDYEQRIKELKEKGYEIAHFWNAMPESNNGRYYRIENDTINRLTEITYADESDPDNPTKATKTISVLDTENGEVKGTILLKDTYNAEAGDLETRYTLVEKNGEVFGMTIIDFEFDSPEAGKVTGVSVEDVPVTYVWFYTVDEDGEQILGDLYSTTVNRVTTTYTWDAPIAGKVTGVTDEVNPVTYIWTYTTVNGSKFIEDIQSSEVGGVTTTYTWDAPEAGKVTGVTDEAKSVTYIWTYTTVKGDKVIGDMQSSEVGGVTTTYTWDVPIVGKVTGVTDEAKSITYIWTYTIDDSSKVIGDMQSSEVGGVTTTYTWDVPEAGKVTGVTDEAKPVTYVWNYTIVEGSKVIGDMQSSEVVGVTITYTWDVPEAGKVTGVTDEQISVTFVWSYTIVDGSKVIGDIVSEEKDGVTTTYTKWNELNADGIGIVEGEDSNGVKYTWEYCINDNDEKEIFRIKSKTTTKTDGTTVTIVYAWDEESGEVTGVTDEDLAVTTVHKFAIDADGIYTFGDIVSVEVDGEIIFFTFDESVPDDLMGRLKDIESGEKLNFVTGRMEDVETGNKLKKYIWEYTVEKKNEKEIKKFGKIRINIDLVKNVTYYYVKYSEPNENGKGKVGGYDSKGNKFVWKYEIDSNGIYTIGDMVVFTPIDTGGGDTTPPDVYDDGEYSWHYDYYPGTTMVMTKEMWEIDAEGNPIGDAPLRTYYFLEEVKDVYEGFTEGRIDHVDYHTGNTIEYIDYVNTADPQDERFSKKLFTDLSGEYRWEEWYYEDTTNYIYRKKFKSGKMYEYYNNANQYIKIQWEANGQGISYSNDAYRRQLWVVMPGEDKVYTFDEYYSESFQHKYRNNYSFDGSNLIYIDSHEYNSAGTYQTTIEKPELVGGSVELVKDGGLIVGINIIPGYAGVLSAVKPVSPSVGKIVSLTVASQTGLPAKPLVMSQGVQYASRTAPSIPSAAGMGFGVLVGSLGSIGGIGIGATRKKEKDLTIYLGISQESLDEIIRHTNDSYPKELEDTYEFEFIPLEEVDSDKMFQEFEEKTEGVATVGAILDKGVLSDMEVFKPDTEDETKTDFHINEFEGIIGDSVQAAREYSVELGNLDLSKEKILSMSEAKIRGLIVLYSRILPLESLKLMQQSAYNLSMDNISTKYFDKNMLKTGLTKAFIDKDKEDQQYVSIAANGAADLRLIANTLNEMGFDKQATSKFLQIRLRDENVTLENKDKFLEATGLVDYISLDNVILTSSEDDTLEEAIETVKITFGEDIDVSRITLGDTQNIIVTAEDESLIRLDKGPRFVQMQGNGIVSQLLITTMKIADDESDIENVKLMDGFGKNWYIYLPAIDRVDYDRIQKEMDKYNAFVVSL